MSRQNAQPLICEARIRISSRSSGSTLASWAAETAAACREPIAAETSGVLFFRATRDMDALLLMGRLYPGGPIREWGTAEMGGVIRAAPRTAPPALSTRRGLAVSRSPRRARRV